MVGHAAWARMSVKLDAWEGEKSDEEADSETADAYGMLDLGSCIVVRLIAKVCWSGPSDRIQCIMM